MLGVICCHDNLISRATIVTCYHSYHGDDVYNTYVELSDDVLYSCVWLYGM